MRCSSCPTQKVSDMSTEAICNTHQCKPRENEIESLIKQLDVDPRLAKEAV